MGRRGRLVALAIAVALASAGTHAGGGNVAVSKHGQANQAPRLGDRCENTKADNGPEICAQWAAANAARNANEINRDALKWNIAGFFALLLTLLATAWAAWAAGSAARAANRSMKLFQSAEAGQLVPKLVVNAYDVVTVSLENVGRTAVTIIHADICCTDTAPDKPVGTFFNELGTFKSDALIGPDSYYIFGGGPMRIGHTNPECWIYGGAIYRTTFGTIEFVPVPIFLDRTTGRYEVEHKIDFSEWEKFAARLQKNRRQ